MNISIFGEDQVHQLLESFPETSTIKRFVHYCSKRTVSPAAFTLFTGISLVSATLDVNYRTSLMPGQDVYAPFWCMIVGPPATGRKSTPVEYGRRILSMVEPKLCEITSIGSAPGLIEALQDHAQRLIYVNDGGSLLSRIAGGAGGPRNGNGEEIKATLLQLFDCAPVNQPLSGRVRVVRDPRMGIILPVNIDEIEDNITKSDWGSGFMSRFSYVYARPERKEIRQRTPNIEMEAVYITQRLQGMHVQPIGPCVDYESKEMEATFLDWMDEKAQHGRTLAERREATVSGRMGAHAMKVAMALAADFDATRGSAWQMPDVCMNIAMRILDHSYQCALGIAQVCGTSKVDRILRGLRSWLSDEDRTLGSIAVELGIMFSTAQEAAVTLVQAGIARMRITNTGIVYIALATQQADPMQQAREELDLDDPNDL